MGRRDFSRAATAGYARNVHHFTGRSFSSDIKRPLSRASAPEETLLALSAAHSLSRDALTRGRLRPL